ncbi:hypothetical protein FAES_2306 [Fibrella aestuarina BUZ 2]|uniref:Uncharacterized protein n=2 Tax=Fibrella TaxID=861914 RepID=I0K862_9BACT|nr:hypothetical protein FAES_2306 [Fibrella aestuarina BUZ 2]
MSQNSRRFAATSTARKIVLIGCLGMSCSVKLIASSMTNPTGVAVYDSLKRLRPVEVPPKTILLTEEGARLALRYKAEALSSRATIVLKDSSIVALGRLVDQKDRQIEQINRQQQAKQNIGQQAQAHTDETRTKLRAARWENWLWRVSVAVFVAAKFKLI